MSDMPIHDKELTKLLRKRNEKATCPNKRDELLRAIEAFSKIDKCSPNAFQRVYLNGDEMLSLKIDGHLITWRIFPYIPAFPADPYHFMKDNEDTEVVVSLAGSEYSYVLYWVSQKEAMKHLMERTIKFKTTTETLEVVNRVTDFLESQHLKANRLNALRLDAAETEKCLARLVDSSSIQEMRLYAAPENMRLFQWRDIRYCKKLFIVFPVDSEAPEQLFFRQLQNEQLEINYYNMREKDMAELIKNWIQNHRPIGTKFCYSVDSGKEASEMLDSIRMETEGFCSSYWPKHAGQSEESRCQMHTSTTTIPMDSERELLLFGKRNSPEEFKKRRFQWSVHMQIVKAGTTKPE